MGSAEAVARCGATNAVLASDEMVIHLRASMLVICLGVGCGEDARRPHDAGENLDSGHTLGDAGSPDASDVNAPDSGGFPDSGVPDGGAVDAGSTGPGAGSARVSLDTLRSIFNVFIETNDPIECGEARLISNADYIQISLWPGVTNFAERDFVGEYELCRESMDDRRCAWGIIVRDNMVDVMTTSVAQDILIESQGEASLTGRFSRDGSVVRFDAPFCER